MTLRVLLIRKKFCKNMEASIFPSRLMGHFKVGILDRAGRSHYHALHFTRCQILSPQGGKDVPKKFNFCKWAVLESEQQEESPTEVFSGHKLLTIKVNETDGETKDLQTLECSEEVVSEMKELSFPTVLEPTVTVIAFDVETTGLRASVDQIIEFAARDLAGGDSSTFSALVNPGRNFSPIISTITGITNEMVNQPHVPSWKDVAPIVIRFVESRRRGDGPVVLVAHNGKTFDAPFLLKKFQECSIRVPEWWLFLDSLSLARETKKMLGYKWPSLKLSDIHDAYGLQAKGRAHRAMADVHMLASILGMLLNDLQLSVSGILKRSFSAEDIMSTSKVFQQDDKEATKGDALLDVSQELEGPPWEMDALMDVSDERLLSIASSESEPAVSVSSMPVDEEEYDDCVETASASSEFSPLLKHYIEKKVNRPEFVHLFKTGSFYEAFFEDAETIAEICNLKLRSVDGGKLSPISVPVARVPGNIIDACVKSVLGKGLKIYKHQQLEESMIVEERSQELGAALTPGILLDHAIIDGPRNNYVAAVIPGVNSWGLAFYDVSTGDFFTTQGESQSDLVREVCRVKPVEVIMPSNVPAMRMPFNCHLASMPITEFCPISDDADGISLFGAESMRELRSKPLADCTAGAVLRYVQLIVGSPLEELTARHISLYSLQSFLSIDETTREYLGLFDSGISLLSSIDRTKTCMGGRLIRKWLSQPLLHTELITSRLDAVEALVNNSNIRTRLRSSLSNVMDIERLASRVVSKWPSEWEDLFEFAESILIIRKLSSILSKLPDNVYFSTVAISPVVLELAEELQVVLLETYDDKALVRDGVDKSLDSLRTGISDCDKLMKEAEFYASFEEASGAKPTRKKFKKANIPQVIECETRRIELTSQAARREEELMETFKRKVIFSLKGIQQTCQAMAALDVLCSFAEVAATRNYCRPHILCGGREMTIVDGRHPVAEISLEEERKFVPNSLNIGSESTSKTEGNQNKRPELVILTGPTGSGKSCYLKQIGAIQILAQCGSFVPAKMARLSVVDSIYSQHTNSLNDSASILQNATCNSLVLLDETEFGNSEAITRAVVEYFLQHIRSRTLVSTRYSDLYQLEEDFPNVANYQFTSSDHSIQAGHYSQLHPATLARTAGFPDWVCNRASELLSTEASEALLIPDAGDNDLTSASSNSEVSSTNGSLASESEEKSDEDSSTMSYWRNWILNWTKIENSVDLEVSKDELNDLWQKVSSLLKNSPATRALAKQKGSLISISRTSQPVIITLGSSPLFVKKFKQQEHASALEVAFETLFNQPIELHVNSTSDSSNIMKDVV